MKLKSNKISKLIIIGLIGFSSFILLFVFLMQIGLLDNFYESYKMRQLKNVKKKIISKEEIDISFLEDIAYFCIF